MNHSNLRFLLLLGAMIAAFPAYSQQAASSAAPTGTPAPAATAPAATAPAATAPAATAPATPAQSPASTTTTSDTAPAGPSAEILAKAKSLGLKTEVRGGVTQYCWDDASVGSRFTTKKCVGESQLNEVIAQREALKDNMRKSMTSSH
jgi:hypothetical protein